MAVPCLADTPNDLRIRARTGSTEVKDQAEIVPALRTALLNLMGLVGPGVQGSTLVAASGSALS